MAMVWAMVWAPGRRKSFPDTANWLPAAVQP